MAKHVAETTQTEFPWQSVVRSIFEAVVAFAALSPLIYTAITNSDPAQAVGWAAVALGVMGAITRVMALPGVEAWLQRFVPFLAAAPGDLKRKADLQARQTGPDTFDATPGGDV